MCTRCEGEEREERDWCLVLAQWRSEDRSTKSQVTGQSSPSSYVDTETHKPAKLGCFEKGKESRQNKCGECWIVTEYERCLNVGSIQSQVWHFCPDSQKPAMLLGISLLGS